MSIFALARRCRRAVAHQLARLARRVRPGRIWARRARKRRLRALLELRELRARLPPLTRQHKEVGRLETQNHLETLGQMRYRLLGLQQLDLFEHHSAACFRSLLRGFSMLSHLEAAPHARRVASQEIERHNCET